MTNYKAFISYKHAKKDGSYAKALESSLKKYAKPLFKLPIRVFRDESELIPGKGLKDSIQEALNASEFLIFIASVESAQSQWIKEELTNWFNSNEDVDNLIIVCIGGNIEYDSLNRTIDWENTNAIPFSLKTYITSIPLYIDLRWVENKDELSLTNVRYRECINAISARLHHKTPYEMNGVEIKATKKNIRLKNYALFSISCLLIVSVFLGIYSNIQRKTAIKRAKIAESRSLALQSNAIIDKSFDEALLLASQSYSTEKTVESKGALLDVLNYNPSLDFYMYSKDVFQKNGLFDRLNDSILITHGFHNQLRIWNLPKRKMIETLEFGQNISTISLSENGKVLVIGHLNGNITVFPKYPNLKNRLVLPEIGPSKINSIVFVANDLFAFSSSNGVSLYNLSSKKETILSQDKEDRSSVLIYRSKDSILIAKGAYELISFWDLSNRDKVKKVQLNARADIPYSISINEDETLAAIGYHDGTVSIWDLNKKTSIGTFPTNGRVLAIKFIGRYKLLTSSDEGQIILRDLQNPNEKKIFRGNNGPVDKIILDEDSETMVSLSREGKIAIYNLNKQSHLIENKSSIEVYDFPKIAANLNTKSILLAAQKELFLYDVKKKIIQSLMTFQNKIESIELHKSGIGFITSHANGKIISWNINDKKISRRDSVELDTPIIDSKNYANNKFILRNKNGKFQEYDFLNNSLKRLSMPTDTIKDRVVAFQRQSNGNIYAIALSNFKVILYDADKAETIKTLEFDTEIRHLLFSKDGNRLFIVDWNLIKVWSISENKYKIKSLTTNELPINNFTINEDFNYIIASDNNKQITIWDLISFKQIGSAIQGFISNPQFITFYKNDSNLVFIDSRYETVKMDHFPFEQGQHIIDIYKMNMRFKELNDKVLNILNN
ncbi:TIR domain-containing protein [Aquimarina sp. AU119]|uniref:TIR domain-containing protein n=1 Tax=Aquimarina sp. AU119 TaxID=2108528 RepID=UPI000D687C0E|nr:TIR domain-containing protein [Aquimarina sp. AU119]